MLLCLKINEFNEKSCSKEVDAFVTCQKASEVKCVCVCEGGGVGCWCWPLILMFDITNISTTLSRLSIINLVSEAQSS